MSTGPEAQLQAQVIELARLYRWRAAHFRPAQTSRGWRTPVEADGAGFPDLVLTRPPELLIVELKSDKGVLSPNQKAWISDLEQIAEQATASRKGDIYGIEFAVEVHIWRPADWDDIQARLSQPAMRVI